MFMEVSWCQELSGELGIINNRFWKRKKANENVDKMSPYDPFVNLNWKASTKLTLYAQNLCIFPNFKTWLQVPYTLPEAGIYVYTDMKLISFSCWLHMAALQKG